MHRRRDGLISTESAMGSSRSLELVQKSEADAIYSDESDKALSEADSLLLREHLPRPDAELEKKWYKALYEEDSRRLMELLRENTGLWKRGWEAEPRRVEGRRFNYWKPETGSPWTGRTALHVGVRRGNLQLLEKVLKLCEEENSNASSLQHLLYAMDSEYELDAIAMAVVNGNRDIVRVLFEAGSKCERIRWDYNIQVIDGEVRLAEDRRYRDELSSITREVIGLFKNQSWFRVVVLRRYELHRDFNFLPLEEHPECLFHFLFTSVGFEEATEVMKTENLGMSSEEYFKLLAGKMSAVVLHEIAARAITSDGLVEYMWAMQDGQGRPPLHVAVDEEENPHLVRGKALTLTRYAASVDEETLKKTIFSRDGQGRTAVHRATAHRFWRESLGTFLQLENASGYDEFWADDLGGQDFYYRVSDVFNSLYGIGTLTTAASNAFRDCLALGIEIKSSWTSNKGTKYCIDLSGLNTRHGFSKVAWSGGPPIQNAILHKNVRACTAIGSAFRSMSIQHQGETKLKVVDARGLKAAFTARVNTARKVLNHHGADEAKQREAKLIPAVSLAAAWGKYDLLQLFTDAGHDPLAEDFYGNTALHYVTKGMSIVEGELGPLSFGLVDFVNCQQIFEWKVRIKEDRRASSNPECLMTEQHLHEKALADRQGCTNFLMQQGCDIFKTNKIGEAPYPSGNANPEFLKWWHEIQSKEFEAAQSAQSMAANAISVTAALVATASYVGPLQPPLGYTDDDPTQLRLGITAVKVFIICDTMSFYLAVAAIIFALVPCLPMPQQPMKDELRRTRRMVNTAVCALFPSIICVVVAFAAGSIAVIRTNQSKWNFGGLTIGSAAVGGFICLIAIVIFTIRVLTIIFYRNKKIKKLYEATSF